MQNYNYLSISAINNRHFLSEEVSRQSEFVFFINCYFRLQKVLGQSYCLGSVVALGIVARTGWDRGPTAEPQKPDGEAGTPKRKTILLLSRHGIGSEACIKK